MFTKSDSKSQEIFYRQVRANRQPVNTLRLRKVFKPVRVGHRAWREAATHHRAGGRASAMKMGSGIAGPRI
jgi:hypothetical protein